ncbi:MULTISPECIES: ribosomal protein S18-alanine N-acetyltransferase [unclassified Rhizobium]|uniref:ribosomal protein S18-alanine N-acetyltransferase n=1 Tax=unclassified Rhizobium TaxID=2613769 RepID=UPI0007145CF7|nr:MULTISPECIES: ribosomal protein S18-alanine N-acetyltransferase [unclassified Rhizobium]KQS90451.1 ribosomal-protein-alanine acetyltransferase [Rhizobium sp. Leaf386]KQS90646.1 ribosomal-protein-alanine acetyltransferase [Rhizobium sp. Leaf391]KQU10192.1 ribosomal-protein-alanine acetyltransferase [Rhizobium sp. Leaf453]
MSLTDYFVRKPEFDIFPLEAADLPRAAAIHKLRFTHAWSDGELHALLVQDTVFGFVASQSNAARRIVAGFVLARVAAGEAEILTIGIDPKFARLGLGWRLMRAAIRQARDQAAEAVFLEVDETNLAAVALYRKLGFAKVGERRAYYQDVNGKKTGALVMRLDLG